jgi:hypothetical protein
LHANASIDVSSFIGGAVAQLGARLDGIEEVVGSNPIGSTKSVHYKIRVFFSPSAPNSYLAFFVRQSFSSIFVIFAAFREATQRGTNGEWIR